MTLSREARIGIAVGLTIAGLALVGCGGLAAGSTVIEAQPAPTSTITPLLPTKMESRELAPENIEAFRQKLHNLLPEKASVDYYVVDPRTPGYWGIQHWLRINENVRINYHSSTLIRDFYYSTSDTATLKIVNWLEGVVKKYGCPLTVEQLEEYTANPQSARALLGLVGVEYPGINKQGLSVENAAGITVGQVDEHEDNPYPNYYALLPTDTFSYPDCSKGATAGNPTFGSNRPIVVYVP